MSFLSEVEKKLDLPPGEKAQVLKELESHYREVEEELTATGMDEREVATEAARRLGEPQDVASRLQTVHCRASWKSAILTVLPFLFVALLAYRLPLTARFGPIPVSAVLIAAGAVIIAGTVRELVLDRRPIWLTTWLVVAGLAQTPVGDHVNPWILREILSLAILIGFLHLIGGRSKGWKPIICILVAVSLLSGIRERYLPHNLSHTTVWLGELSHVIGIILFMGGLFMVVAIVAKTFSWHRYGDVAQAALFSFTAMVLGSRRVYPTCDQPIAVLRDCTICGIAALLFAVLPNWKLRVSAVAIGLVAKFLADTVADASRSSGPSVDILKLLVLAWMTIGLPLLYREIRYGGRPKFSW